MKVNFVIAGTQKGGTTALNYYLKQHKEICMAQKKETHFFDIDSNFKNGIKYYHSLFKDPKNKLVGEATPIYMYWAPCAQRIWEYNKNMKIILLLRNPVDRAISHWNMEYNRKNDKLLFDKAIYNERARLRSLAPQQSRIYSYIDRGFYSEQIRRLWKFFPEKQTLILRSSDLKNNALTTLNKIYEFLGVSKIKNIEEQLVFASKNKILVTDQEYHYLEKIYAGEITMLENMLGWDCSSWRT